jgi:uncharacterized secreted repeat protein (TIGR03808 family)
MTLSRRHLLLGSLSGAAVCAAPLRAETGRPQGLDASSLGVAPNSADDQTRALQRAIDRAAQAGQPLWLPPGLYRAGPLTLPAGARLIGARGATRIALTQGPSLISAQGVDHVTLQGVTLDGGNRPLARDGGLVHGNAAQRLRIADCALVNAKGNAIALFKCDGVVAGNAIAGASDNAVLSLDGRMTIRANHISNAGNGGIRVWRSVKQDDGSLIEDNIIEDTAARGGGDGQNGNAINVYRAAQVIVRDNVIRRAAFTAVRGNSASHIQILGNQCHGLGEVAIYSEFQFEDATIADNLVDGAAVGISVTNMDQGGHGAVVRGNVIRNIVNKRPQGGPDSYGIGIGVEADTDVIGNTIDNAPTIGIEVGTGPYLRNVTVSNNTLRTVGIGIGVSVVDGAGAAAITDNTIAGATRGAIRGMAWDKPVTGDLAQGGAENYPRLRISGNRVS